MKLLYTLIFAFFISCSTEPEEVHGCLDSTACNYNPLTTLDNNSCEYIDNCDVCDNDPDNDCVEDECGVWGGGNLACIDDCGIPFGSNFTCTGCIDLAAENYGDWLYPCENCCYYDSINYDVNDDGDINVLDVVNIVNNIINDIIPSENEDVIVNGIFDILDATIIVSAFFGRGDTANIVHFYFEEDVASIISDGWVGGIQMTLTHDADFSINLTNNAYIAEYVTNGTTTKLVLIAPESTDIFETTGDFQVVDVKVGGDRYYINSYIN